MTLVQKYGPYAQKRYNDLLKFAAASATAQNLYHDLDDDGFESEDIGMLYHKALDLTK